MKFKFSLEPLLKYRKNLEQEALREFAHAQSELDAALAELDRFYKSIDDARMMTEDVRIEGGKNSEQLMILDEFISGQFVKIERQKQVIRERKMVVEEKQLLHEKAAVEFKVIEKLKEKKHQAHKLVERKKEIKAMDDMIVMRARRHGA